MTNEQTLMAGLMIATLGFVGFLFVGHWRDEFNLFDLVRNDGRKISGRKVARSVALIVSTIAVMYAFAVKADPMWVLAVYLTAWVAHDLLGVLASAKGTVMTGNAGYGSRYWPGSGGGRIGPE